MISPVTLKTLTAAAVLLAVSACDSSSSGSSDSFTSQAVDGYIVGADVFCDDTANGLTQAAGRFDCPADTGLSTVSGGFDVGTDSEATSGTTAFIGVLRAPARELYVTPITTLSLALAQIGQTADFVPDVDGFRAAKITLAETLGVSLTSMGENPALDLDAAKSNAQVHQILAAFAPNVESYEEATVAFAAVLSESANGEGRVGLTEDIAETLVAINTKLSESESSLELATVDLDQATANVIAANTTIQRVDSPARVSTEAKQALIEQAPVTIDREEAVIALTSGDQNVAQPLSIESFEDPLQTDGLYAARLFSGLARVGYDNSVFKFNQSISDAQITVAFELKAVGAGDERSISFVSDDIVVSALKDRPESLVISVLPGNSTFQVLGMDSEGVTTNAVISTDGETISSDGDSFTVDLERINRQLTDLGFEDILATSGGYTVTLVISGLRVSELEGNTTTEAEVFTVNTGAGDITGNGFRGYVSIIR